MKNVCWEALAENIKQMFWIEQKSSVIDQRSRDETAFWRAYRNQFPPCWALISRINQIQTQTIYFNSIIIQKIWFFSHLRTMKFNTVDN